MELLKLRKTKHVYAIKEPKLPSSKVLRAVETEVVEGSKVVSHVLSSEGYTFVHAEEKPEILKLLRKEGMISSAENLETDMQETSSTKQLVRSDGSVVEVEEEVSWFDARIYWNKYYGNHVEMETMRYKEIIEFGKNFIPKNWRTYRTQGHVYVGSKIKEFSKYEEVKVGDCTFYKVPRRIYAMWYRAFMNGLLRESEEIAKEEEARLKKLERSEAKWLNKQEKEFGRVKLS